MTINVRFAPSPTGRLHVGNIRAALVNWIFARQQGGRFFLRIDDTDRERSKIEHEDAIRRDLTWLGLNWDDSFRQSERFERYDALVEKLKADGRLYPCYETAEELDVKRKIQLSRGLPPVYDRGALKLSEAERQKLEMSGLRPHWRFKLDIPGRVEWLDLIRGTVSIDLASLSDPVLIREDGSYLYTLPSVIDDIDYKISHVVRGEDHVTNSAVQIQIFEALGAQAPAMAHFALLTGKGGEGLSKRYGAMSIEEYREEMGVEPLAIAALLARLGTSDPIEAVSSMVPLIDGFSFSKFGRSAAKFDVEELESLNAKILHITPFDAVKERLEGVNEALWLAASPNITKLKDMQIWLKIAQGPIVTDALVADQKGYIEQAHKLLPDGELTAASWTEWTGALKAATGRKGKELFMPLRLALTGEAHGPDMGQLLPLIGRARVLARLEGKSA